MPHPFPLTGLQLRSLVQASGAQATPCPWATKALAGQILNGMEAALNRTATVSSRYGSSTHKQVYIYGGLDSRPTEWVRNFGFSWGSKYLINPNQTSGH
jgi:NADPH2:quinone reductase